MKKVKRVLALVIALLVCVALTACGQPSASDQVKKDIEAFKGDQEAIINVINTKFGDDGMISDAIRDDEEVQTFLAKAADFDYEIIEESIAEDGESGSVLVKVKTYPLGESYTVMLREMVIDGIKGEIDDSISDDEFFMRLFSRINSVQFDEKAYEDVATIHCVKENGKWTTDISKSGGENADAENPDTGEPGEFEDAALGGLLSAIEDVNTNGVKIADTLEEYSEIVPEFTYSFINQTEDENTKAAVEGNKIIFTVDITSALGSGRTVDDNFRTVVKESYDKEFGTIESNFKNAITALEKKTNISGISIELVIVYDGIELYRRETTA